MKADDDMTWLPAWMASHRSIPKEPQRVRTPRFQLLLLLTNVESIRVLLFLNSM